MWVKPKLSVGPLLAGCNKCHQYMFLLYTWEEEETWWPSLLRSMMSNDAFSQDLRTFSRQMCACIWWWRVWTRTNRNQVRTVHSVPVALNVEFFIPSSCPSFRCDEEFAVWCDEDVFIPDLRVWHTVLVVVISQTMTQNTDTDVNCKFMFLFHIIFNDEHSVLFCLIHVHLFQRLFYGHSGGMKGFFQKDFKHEGQIIRVTSDGSQKRVWNEERHNKKKKEGVRRTKWAESGSSVSRWECECWCTFLVSLGPWNVVSLFTATHFSLCPLAVHELSL